MSRACLVAVRAYDVVTPAPTFGDPYDAPRWPAAFTASREDAGWWTLRTSGGAVLHARVLGRNAANTVLCVLLYGPAAIIRAIADASPNAWTLAELQADNSTIAQRVKALLSQRGPATIAGESDDLAKDDGT